MPSDIFPIILNSTNAVSPAEYIYKFPRGSINLKNASIAVNNINMYYSWANVNKALYNNADFSIDFPDGSGIKSLAITLPDGNYEVSDINSYIQKVFVDNGLYHINNTTGQYRYYYELVANPITYKIDSIAYEVPTSTPTGFSTDPAGWGKGVISYPIAPTEPFIIIPAVGNFGTLIGFSPGGHFDHSSDFTPQIAEVSSVLVRCSLISNKFTNPNDIIHSFTSKGQKFGSMISVENNNLIFSRIPDGFYTELKILFCDQFYRRLNIQDNNILIHLVLQIENE